MKSAGLCGCGCGNLAPIAHRNRALRGHVQGQPLRFIHGHNTLVHGHNSRGNRSAEYTVWDNMIRRCENPANPRFKHYGGKGITVCARWRHSFLNFLSDMGRRPSVKHSIDRYPNPNGNYEPTNTRWATQGEQALNRNSVRLRDVDERRISVATAAAHLALPPTTFRNLMRLP